MLHFYKKTVLLLVILAASFASMAQIAPSSSPYNLPGPYSIVADSNMTLFRPILTYRPATNVDAPYPLLIFQMGAYLLGDTHLDWHDYDLYLQHLASYGYVVVMIDHNPLGTPFSPYFDQTMSHIDQEMAISGTWMNEYIDTSRVAVGGHSFGGVVASQYVSTNPERIDAVIYFASYPFIAPVVGQNVGTFTGKLLTIAGSEDTDTDSTAAWDGYEAYTSASCRAWYYIEGMGHAGFADYSHPTQVVGSIGRADATSTIRHLLISFLESEFKGDNLANCYFTQPDSYLTSIRNYENDCAYTADCEQPENLSVNAAGNVATFTWEANSFADLTQIQYRINPANGGGGNGTAIVPGGINLKNINGLTCGVNYQSRSRHFCKDGSISPWKFRSFPSPPCVKGSHYIGGVYPNPAKEMTYISVSSETAGAAVVKTVDITGTVLDEMQTNFAKGINAIALDLEQHSPGIYLIIVKCRDVTQTYRLVKQ